MNPFDELRALDGKDDLAIAPEEGEYLFNLVKEKKPQVLVELGTGHGFSTVWMSMAMDPKGVLITIDRVDRPHLFKDDRFRPFCHKIRFLKGELDEFYAELPDKIDMAFLDSEHSINNIIYDAETLMPNMKPGGVIVVHDTVYCTEMGHCLKDYFEGVHSERLQTVLERPLMVPWDYQHVPLRYGLGVATKLGKGKDDGIGQRTETLVHSSGL